jgi:putative peptidoglycan lipid II flippase
VCSCGQILLQVVFQVLLARLFGASDQMDAFNAALALPTVISTVVAGALPPVLIPVIIHRREEAGLEQARETATLVGLLLAIGLAAVCAAVRWSSEPLMAALQPGFSAEQVNQTARLFRILVWLIWTQSFAALLQAIAHTEQQFLVPALAPIAGGLCTVGWVWLGSRQQGIDAVTAGVVAGSLLIVALQLPAFMRNFKLPKEWDEGTRRIWGLAWPLLLGALYYKLDPLVDRYLASLMPAGSISHLGYAVRIIGTLLTLSTSGLAVVVFPVLSRHAAVGEEQEMKAEVMRAFRFLIFALTPVAIGLVLFHRPVIRDLMEHQQFTPHDTEIVGTLVALSVGVLLGGSAGEILVRTSFALRDTRTPMLIGIAGFTVGVLLKWRLAGVLGLSGLALATSTYYLLNGVLQFCVLSKRLGWLIPPDILAVTGRALFGSAGAVITAFAILQLGFPFVSVAAAAAAGLVYLALTGWAGDEFARSLIRFVRASGES